MERHQSTWTKKNVLFHTITEKSISPPFEDGLWHKIINQVEITRANALSTLKTA
jgi:hypothetical protein